MTKTDSMLKLLQSIVDGVSLDAAMEEMKTKNKSVVYQMMNGLRHKKYNIVNIDGKYFLKDEKKKNEELAKFPPKNVDILEGLKRQMKFLPEGFQSEAKTLFFDATYAIKNLQSLISAVEDSRKV